MAVEFSITFMDDNLVHIRDTCGREVAFEFPLRNVSFKEYDRFVTQMKNPSRQLPSVEDMIMVIHRPYSAPDRSHRPGDPNSQVNPSTWKQHAERHGMGVREVMTMYVYARNALYARYRARLRDHQNPNRPRRAST